MQQRFEAFATMVLQLNRCVQKIKEQETKKLGLRAQHVMCIYQLGCNPQGVTAAELTRLCREDKAAISRSLAQLAAAGLVTSCGGGGARGYRALHRLTPAGQEMLARIERRIAAAVEAGGSGLTAAQRQNLYLALDTILQNLNRYICREEEP